MFICVFSFVCFAEKVNQILEEVLSRLLDVYELAFKNENRLKKTELDKEIQASVSQWIEVC